MEKTEIKSEKSLEEQVNLERKMKMKKFRRLYTLFVIIPATTYILGVGALDVMAHRYDTKSTSHRWHAVHAKETGQYEEEKKYLHLADKEEQKSKKWEKWCERLDFFGLTD